ncbi:MAG: DUF3848 domain-containing protein [Muribaculaceae bacterium]|nr:DUF3848 domain-containing protein [Muribaculaceae bacterium]
MGERDYNALLYEKVQAEYDAFIGELKTKPAEEVLERAYEKVFKEEMVGICEYANFDRKEAKAMYLEKYPLDRMYQDWLKNDVSYMDMLRDSVDDSLKTAAAERRDRQRDSR